MSFKQRIDEALLVENTVQFVIVYRNNDDFVWTVGPFTQDDALAYANRKADEWYKAYVRIQPTEIIDPNVNPSSLPATDEWHDDRYSPDEVRIHRAENYIGIDAQDEFMMSWEICVLESPQ